MSIGTIFITAVVISFLHGLIPSHWAPILILSKNYNWDNKRLYWISLQASISHALSTIIIGFSLALLGKELQDQMEFLSHTISASIIILLGLWFLFRHYHHHHFHIEKMQGKSEKQVTRSLILAMFFAPCMEVSPLYGMLGAEGFYTVLLLSFVYLLITVGSMMAWIGIGKKLMQKIDAHKWEHNIGLLSGIVLILAGILLYFT